jgi:hypothetical protein
MFDETAYQAEVGEPSIIQVYRLLREYNPKQFVASNNNGKIKIEAQYGDVREDGVSNHLLMGLGQLGVVPVNGPGYDSGWVVLEIPATEEEVVSIRKRNLPYFLLY